MPNVTADKIIGKDLYAKTNVELLDKNFKPLKKITAGQYIGNVYSYIDNPGSKLYWMFYRTQSDYANFNPTYVEHIKGTIECPALPGIIEEIQRKKEQEEMEKSGPINYYIKKYLPWIVGAIALSILIPSLRKK